MLARVLVILATLMVVISSLTIWVKRQVVSTPAWTAAAGRMLEDAHIRGAVSVYLVNELYDHVDVSAKLEEKLPDRLKPLAPVAAGVLRQFGTKAADEVLGEQETIDLWKEANTKAHSELVSVLRGQSSRLVTTNGDVVLDLRPILKRFEGTVLGSKVADKLPADAGKAVIMRADQVDAAKKGARMLRALSLFVSLAILVLYAAALWFSRARRKTLRSVGISLLVAGLLVLVTRHVTGDYLVHALTKSRPDVQPAGAAVWAITTELLWFTGLALLGYGLVITVAAMLAGPARWAVATRRFLAPLLARAPGAAFGAVVAVCAFLLLFGPVDWSRLISLAVLGISALAGVEVLRRQTRREFPAA